MAEDRLQKFSVALPEFVDAAAGKDELLPKLQEVSLLYEDLEEFREVIETRVASMLKERPQIYPRVQWALEHMTPSTPFSIALIKALKKEFKSLTAEEFTMAIISLGADERFHEMDFFAELTERKIVGRHPEAYKLRAKISAARSAAYLEQSKSKDRDRMLGMALRYAEESHIESMQADDHLAEWNMRIKIAREIMPAMDRMADGLRMLGELWIKISKHRITVLQGDIWQGAVKCLYRILCTRLKMALGHEMGLEILECLQLYEKHGNFFMGDQDPVFTEARAYLSSHQAP